MSKILFVILIIASLTFSGSALAAESKDGKVDGIIINGTTEESRVPDLDVTLETYSNQNMVGTLLAKADAEGRFQFGNLATGPEYVYQAVVKYQDVEYRSDLIVFSENTTSTSTNVTVYEPTSTDEGVRIAMAHAIIYPEADSLLVKEYYLFVNEGKRAFVGPDPGKVGPTLKFTLPEGAVELTPTVGLTKDSIISRNDGFDDTMPIAPGMREVAFSYRLPFNSRGIVLSQVFNYPVGRFDLLAEENSVKLTSSQLQEDAPLTIKDTTYAHLAGGNLARGETITVNVSGARNGGIAWLPMLLIVAVFGGGAAFGVLYFRRKNKTAPHQVARIAVPDDQKQELLAELAQLDDDFAGGKLDEKVYKERRAAKKAQLVELIRAQEKGADKA